MFTKTITYTDFNGVERKEAFYFNLSENEVVEMEFGTNGGYTELLNKIIAAKDQESLLKEIKKFILKAYGEKSSDGRRFMKSEEISRAFSETPAFTKLYMEFLFNDLAFAEFVNAIIPTNVSNTIQKHIEASNEVKAQLSAIATDANLANQ